MSGSSRPPHRPHSAVRVRSAGARRRALRTAALGALCVAASALAAGAGAQSAVADRDAILDASAAWRDLLDAHRAPVWPRPSENEAAILLLSAPPVGSLPRARREAGLEAVRAEQEAVAQALAELGVTVTLRTRVAANAMAVRLPAGGLEAVAQLAQVRAIVPVAFLAPAQADGGAVPSGEAPGGRAAVTATAPGPGPAGARTVRIALIDAGIDPSHPWLGGGMGPTFPVLGGTDMVERDSDPRIDASRVHTEAHGTQMAGLILRSPAISALAPERRPRLIVHRVVDTEAAGGRLRPLARSDRVLGALERSLDPDGDGDPSDRAEVIVIGLASGFGGGGVDPLVDAVTTAERLGSTVVVPAGNDGATLTRPGAVGSLASTPAALTVGAAAVGTRARSARLEARIGPAAAALDDLPLLGPAPADGPLRLRVLRGAGGLASGDAPDDYRDERGDSMVEGAIVVVARGGGDIAQTARQAAAAGARALILWDEQGPASFPATAGDAGLALPVLGVGRAQGDALQQLLDTVGLDVPARILEAPPLEGEAPAPAGFSSWGPTADGLPKPDLLAPAVAVEAPLPGRGPGGRPRMGTLSGTSAATAEVAARAARLRTDRPDLGSRAVRAILIQNAEPLPGVAPSRQGGGLASDADPAPVHIVPARLISRPREGGEASALTMALVDHSGSAGSYRVTLRDRAGSGVVVAPSVALPASGRVRLTLPLSGPPADAEIVVSAAGGGPELVRAPVAPVRPPDPDPDGLGVPRVRVGDGFAEVLVRVGRLERRDGRVVNTSLRSVRVHLMPVADGDPLPVLGTRQDGAWPAGTYRLMVSRRAADGVPVPAGLYRVRVVAAGADGTVLRRESARFRLD